LKKYNLGKIPGYGRRNSPNPAISIALTECDRPHIDPSKTPVRARKQGNRETRKQGNRETRKQGNKQTGKQVNKEIIKTSKQVNK
jgi:hypothetical protein